MGALPAILETTPSSFLTETIAVVQKNAELAFSRLKEAPGLQPVMPQVSIL